METEVAGRRAVVGGLISISTTLGVDGTVVLSDRAFFRMLPGSGRSAVMLGLVRLRPGADAGGIRVQLARQLPGDVTVYTRQGFIQREQQYWRSNTPIGFICQPGGAMGLVPGALLTVVIYHCVAQATFLPLAMTLSRMVTVYARAAGMCLAAAAFAARSDLWTPPKSSK